MPQSAAQPAHCFACVAKGQTQDFDRYPESPADDRMAQPVVVAGFDLSGESIEEADDDGSTAKTAQSADQQTKLRIIPDVKGGFIDGGFEKPYHRCDHQHHKPGAAHRIEIQRDSVDGGKMNFTLTSAAGHGAEEYQRNDENQQRTQNQGDIEVAVGV